MEMGLEEVDWAEDFVLCISVKTITNYVQWNDGKY